MIADLRRLLEGPHTIDEKPLKVINQPPKKKVPLDPLKVHVQGLNEKTTKDSLWFYLEKFSKVDVTEVYMGCNNNAMAVFDFEQGKKIYWSLLVFVFFSIVVVLSWTIKNVFIQKKVSGFFYFLTFARTFDFMCFGPFVKRYSFSSKVLRAYLLLKLRCYPWSMHSVWE